MRTPTKGNKYTLTQRKGRASLPSRDHMTYIPTTPTRPPIGLPRPLGWPPPPLVVLHDRRDTIRPSRLHRAPPFGHLSASSETAESLGSEAYVYRSVVIDPPPPKKKKTWQFPGKPVLSLTKVWQRLKCTFLTVSKPNIGNKSPRLTFRSAPNCKNR